MKKMYKEPQIDMIVVRVEKGFAVSEASSNVGIDGFYPDGDGENSGL